MVAGRRPAVQGPVQLGELGRGGAVPRQAEGLGQRWAVRDHRFPLGGPRHIVRVGELRLERGLRDRDEQRDEFRWRGRPGRLELVHDQEAVVEVSASDEVVRSGVLCRRELGRQVRHGLWVGLIVDDRQSEGLRVSDCGLRGERRERIARIESGDLVGRVVRFEPIHGALQVDRRGAQDFHEVSTRGLRPNQVRGTPVGEHNPIVIVCDRRRGGRETAAVRRQEELGSILLNNPRVQRPDVPAHALVVVVVKADVVQFAADGDAAMAIEPVRRRLDAVQRVRPFDVEVPSLGNGESDFDGPGETGRQGQVIDRGGRDRDENEYERDSDGDEFSSTSRRNRRRGLHRTWR